MYAVTSCKGTTTHATIADALRACGADPHNYAAFGPTITRDDTGEDVSIEVIDADGYCGISVDDVQDLARLAGIDPRENDDDGLHWPYAPTIEEAASAIERLI